MLLVCFACLFWLGFLDLCGLRALLALLDLLGLLASLCLPPSQFACALRYLRYLPARFAHPFPDLLARFAFTLLACFTLFAVLLAY